MRSGLLLLASCSGLFAGCGSASPDCTLTFTLGVTPSTAIADHAATPPGSQQKFYAVREPSAAPGCPLPANAEIAYPAWTNPVPLAISISSAQDQTNGLATSLKATSGAVTLTATVGTGLTAQSKTVQLTCK